MAQGIRNIKNKIRFLERDLDDPKAYTFAIIASRYKEQWIWVRHQDRLTWELPAGHLEPGETVEQAAFRELHEETGAIEYTLFPVGSYQGIHNGNVVYGKIFHAEVGQLGPLPLHEIVEIRLENGIPASLTYPEIQPLFFELVLRQFHNQL